MSTLELEVYYAWDLVRGTSDVGATVWVTVTDNLGTNKEEALVTADESGLFFVGCDDWFSGWCPDILPGDHLFVWATGLAGEISPIGAILVDSLDTVANTVSGTLHAEWFEGPLVVRC
ncbi:MAG: hypothetical protein P1S60_08755 [Anaerolineae bacterium]|nr:hypothetical protein [Anaerolineae bacterium]